MKLEDPLELAGSELELTRAQLQTALLAFEQVQTTLDQSQTSDPGKNYRFATLLDVDNPIDAREDFCGHNWYHAEHDGRWAGRGNASTIFLKKLPPGQFTLSLEFVRLVSIDIARAVEISLNGAVLPSSIRDQPRPGRLQRRLGRAESFQYPLIYDAAVSLSSREGEMVDTLVIRFPFTKVPNEKDGRSLTGRLLSVTLSPRE